MKSYNWTKCELLNYFFIQELHHKMVQFFLQNLVTGPIISISCKSSVNPNVNPVFWLFQSFFAFEKNRSPWKETILGLLKAKKLIYVVLTLHWIIENRATNSFRSWLQELLFTRKGQIIDCQVSVMVMVMVLSCFFGKIFRTFIWYNYFHWPNILIHWEGGDYHYTIGIQAIPTIPTIHIVQKFRLPEMT